MGVHSQERQGEYFISHFTYYLFPITYYLPSTYHLPPPESNATSNSNHTHPTPFPHPLHLPTPPPSTLQRERQEQNLDVCGWELDSTDMEALDGLTTPGQSTWLLVTWLLVNVGTK